jgi:hypothetical protein
MCKDKLPDEVISILGDNNIDDISIKVIYKNWKKEVGLRMIIPLSIFYGTNEYHKDEQWLLKVWDLDKNDYRTYALGDIQEWSCSRKT